MYFNSTEIQDTVTVTHKRSQFSTCNVMWEKAFVCLARVHLHSWHMELNFSRFLFWPKKHRVKLISGVRVLISVTSAMN